MEQSNDFSPMPTPQEFLLDTPIYKEFSSEGVSELRDFKDTLDFYCVECGKQSVFYRSDDTPSQIMARSPSGGGFGYFSRKDSGVILFEMHFKCSRVKEHEAVFYFRASNDSVCKIGEFPSKASVFSEDIQEYKKLLGKEQMSLQLAQELYSQDIGAGSFVYLRRIFENVILERVATRKYKNIENWTFQEWKKSKSRMEDRLRDIADELPSFINHHELFNVLSVGVHSLDEETCLQWFPDVKKAITEILDIEILEAKKEKNREILGKDISKMNSSVRKPKNA